MKNKLFLLLILGVTSILNPLVAQEIPEKQCSSTSENEHVRSKFDEWMNSNWAISLSGGSNLFYGDLRVYDLWPVKEYHNERKSAFSIGLEKELNDFFTVKGNFLHGSLSGTKRKFESGAPANMYFDAKITEYSSVLELDILNALVGVQDRTLSLFAYAGLGIVDFRTQRKSLITNQVLESYGYNGSKLVSPTREVVFPIGFGVDYNFTQSFSLNFDMSLRIVNTDKLDAYTSNSNNKFFQDMYGYTAIGITYKFGYKDCDGDGVVNKFDKCPGTPYGMLVDKDGCVSDTDGDGIADADDACPEIPGPASTKGCPDSDGDGIADKDDKCPKEKGLVEFQGCPDTDGDGIADYEDRCPKEKGSKELFGCPDKDGDGIADYEDRCPDFAGSIELNGCPDRDGDGIADIDDKCPDAAGIAANKGCPEVKKEVLRIFERALTGIQFETGKDVIKKTSYPILDQVVKAMKDNPEYNLQINGHTDNVGDAQKNMLLSDKRAAAVKSYMVAKGVAADRMLAKGFGDTLPIADNKTEAGRAKNRRVEFKVEFEVLEVIVE